MNRRPTIILAMLIATLLLAPLALAALDNYKLNEELPDGGDVDDLFQISPNGESVVYLAGQDDADVQELYRVPITGGETTKLNGTLVENGDVNRFEISPDNQQVVYRADQETSGADELYSVPLTGGVPIKLNGLLAPGSRVLSFEITANSEQVVYAAEHEADGELAYHSVPIGGGTTSRLSHSLGTDDLLGNFQISPNGETVVYWIKVYFDPDSLYSVPISGGSATFLGSAASILEYAIDATSTYAVFRTQDSGPGYDNHLYSVSLSGGTPQQLDAPTEPEPSIESFKISPDGAYVVYAGMQTGYSELLSVPIGGGTPVKLSLGVQQVGPTWVDAEYAISPDSQWVVYGSDSTDPDYIGYYRVAIDGGTPDALAVGSGYQGSQIHISPDGTWVVWAASANPWRYLTSVPLAGGALHGLDWTSPSISTVQIRPDSQSVVYLGGPTPWQIYSVPIDGGSRGALNGNLPEDGNVSSDFGISPDSQTVVYHADQEADELFELWATTGVPSAGFRVYLPLIVKGQ